MARVLALLALGATAVAAQEVVETVIEVERVEPRKPKHESLRFLEENRDFFRAELDLLRLCEATRRETEATGIDPRILDFQRMLDEIRAAQDSARAGDERARRRGLLQSVQDLAELEREMDRMERLLDEQSARLAQLGENFVGEQRTTLVVVLTGVPATGSPKTVILQGDDGTATNVLLNERDRLSLASGGTAELVHELVEPRRQKLAISFEGPGWDQPQPYEVVLEPQRDRMTFLELDLRKADPESPGESVAARTWTR